MHASRLGGSDHNLGIHLTEAGDILGDTSVKQLHILRQIAHLRSELIAGEQPQIHPIQAQLSLIGPSSGQCSREGGLARTAGADHAQCFAGLDLELQPMQDGSPGLWRSDRQVQGSEATRQDWFLTYVIINPQADRSKAWGEQAEADLSARIVDEDAGGITIRGGKMLGTSSIMANEVLVANLQPLKPGEESLAFSCALPMNTKGIKVLSRKSYEAHAVSKWDNPLSSRFDENDAVLWFQDVKVPWERVFVHRDTDMCRAQFHDTWGHTMQNYQAQIRLTEKLRFLTGIARRVAETIGTVNMPPVRDALGKLAAQAAGVEAILHGMEASGAQQGEWFVPNKHMMYAAQVLTQELYPQVVATIRDLAGGGMIMLPSSAADYGNPEMARIIRTTQQSPMSTPDERVKFMKLAWDAVGSEFASRHLQYEMFYAGAQFVTRGHSWRTYDWDRALGMVDGLLDSYAMPENTPADIMTPGRAA